MSLLLFIYFIPLQKNCSLIVLINTRMRKTQKKKKITISMAIANTIITAALIVIINYVKRC